jgi:hypothetical protein
MPWCWMWRRRPRSRLMPGCLGGGAAGVPAGLRGGRPRGAGDRRPPSPTAATEPRLQPGLAHRVAHRVAHQEQAALTAGDANRASLLLPVTHETPGDSLARGLPSPVCTARVGRQSRRQETVTDDGECPAQRQCGVWRAIRNLCHLSAALPKPYSASCCPSAALTRVVAFSWDALPVGIGDQSRTSSRLERLVAEWPPSTTTAATRARLARPARRWHRTCYRRRVVDSRSMRSSSSLVREKPKTSKLAAIRSGVADLGITTTSWSMCQRTTT